MGYLAISSQQQTGPQHLDEINGEVAALLLIAAPLLPRKGWSSAIPKSKQLCSDVMVEEDVKILILDNVKPLWSAESCGVCWEKKSYCSNQDLVQLPTLFLNLQHK